MMDITSLDAGTRDATVTSSMTSSADESCRLYDFVVCTVLIGAFCVFGLLGNATSFVVFCRQHKSDAAASAVLLFQCMAVTDSLLLLVAIAVYVLPAVYPYTGHLQIDYETFDYIVYVWPPAMIFHTVTVWLTVLVSVNRYSAVCRAVEEFGTTTKQLRRTRIQIVVVIILSLLYNVPRFFEHQVSFRSITEQCYQVLIWGNNDNIYV